MLEKPCKPWPPSKLDYKKRTERQYLYSYKESLDYYREDEEDDEEEKPERDIKDVNLSWLISLIPEGVRPDEVKIKFGFETNAMGYENHYVKFYYEKEIPADPKGYKLAIKEYELLLAKYEKDLKLYEEALKKQEIEEAEKQIKEASEKLKQLKESI